MKYWVFRRYRVTPDYEIEECFALHYVDPFSTRRSAERAIREAKILHHPEQKFIVLRG